jgi:predicted transcriptional regulator
MKPLKTKVSLTLDNDLLESLKNMAENDDRSLSQYINMALKKWVSANNAPTPHPQETSCK